MGGPGSSRWTDFLQRYFGVRHPERVNVLTDVMPVVNLLEEAPELRYYRGERRYVASSTIAAGGAATYATKTWGLQADATHFVVVERIMASRASGGAWIVGALQGGAAAYTSSLGTARPLDSRVQPVSTSAFIQTDIWIADTAPAANLAVNARIDSWQSVANTMSWSPYFPGFVLEPGGHALQLQTVTANEGFDTWLLCYDIPIHGVEDV